MSIPEVYTIILNYNGRLHLEYCLPSIIKTEYENQKIILVDNNSSDDSKQFAEKFHKEIQWIQTGENLQWAGGNNYGIRYALNKNPDYIALLNNDLLFDPRWLKEGVKVMESDNQIGILGFEMYDNLIKNSKKKFHRAVAEKKELEYNLTENVRGAAMLIRKEVFDRIGYFDEVYGSYGEETDFESRTVRAGFKMVNTNIPIWHYSEGSWEKYRLRKSYFSIRNTIRFSLKNRGLIQTIHKTLQIINTGCNPFINKSELNYIEQRYRPYNIVINFFIILVCILWNIIYSSQTYNIKCNEEKLINRTAKINL